MPFKFAEHACSQYVCKVVGYSSAWPMVIKAAMPRQHELIDARHLTSSLRTVVIIPFIEWALQASCQHPANCAAEDQPGSRFSCRHLQQRVTDMHLQKGTSCLTPKRH